MPKHTGLPWHKVSRDGHSRDWKPRDVITAPGVDRIAIVSKRGVNSLEEAEANADIILCACNNHYGMLEALENIITAIFEYGMANEIDIETLVNDTPKLDGITQSISEARQVIAKVKGATTQ